VSKSVYIFGAGADKNAYGEMPLGNDFVVRIFANLDETKKIVNYPPPKEAGACRNASSVD